MRAGHPAATLGDVRVGGGAPVVVMGALNVSPESFYAGSVHVETRELVRAAVAMVDAGAAILDVGAMSTAPYRAGRVSESEEAGRLSFAIAAVTREVHVPISADTARLDPARAAFDAGASILNDVSGLSNERVGRLAAERGASLIAMASPAAAGAAKIPIDTADPVGTVHACLAASLGRAVDLGIPSDRIVLDPGIGFFLEAPEARAAWDVAVLAELAHFAALGAPLAIGVSRKSFVGTVTGRTSPEARLPGSLAATAIAVRAGAVLVRTHDVAETVDAARLTERVMRASERAP